MGALLEVEHLTLVAGEREVLRDVSFTLEAGRTLAVIGPNGCGKSLLLKALLGLWPYTGSVRWAAGARLGYIPQNLQFDRGVPLLVSELLSARAKLLRFSEHHIGEICDATDLHSLLPMQVGQLSGGQMQRLLLALALLPSPAALLCDEPAASLDEPTGEQMYALLQRLQQEKQLAFVLVSHDLSVVSKYADYVLCLGHGTWRMEAPGAVLRAETLERIYGRGATPHRHSPSLTKAAGQ